MHFKLKTDLFSQVPILYRNQYDSLSQYLFIGTTIHKYIINNKTNHSVISLVNDMLEITCQNKCKLQK